MKPHLLALFLAVPAGFLPAVAQSSAAKSAAAAYEKCRCAEAVVELERLANAGDSLAQRYLGIALESGKGVKQSHTLAIPWYRKSMSQGDNAAALRLASLYRRLGLEDEAEQVLSKVPQGSPDSAEALVEAARLAMQGKPGEPPDYQGARALLLKAWESGSKTARPELAALVLQKFDGPPDKEIITAVEAVGDGRALLKIAELYTNTQEPYRSHFAALYFAAAGKRGHTEAYLRGAEYFARGRARGMAGRGYSPNYDRAVSFLERAAASGEPRFVLPARRMLDGLMDKRRREVRDHPLSILEESRLDESNVTYRRERSGSIQLILCNAEKRQARVASLIRACPGWLLGESECTEYVAAGWSYFEPGQCKPVRVGADNRVLLSIFRRTPEGEWSPESFSPETKAVKEGHSTMTGVSEVDCGDVLEDFLIFSSGQGGASCAEGNLLYTLALRVIDDLTLEF